MTAEDGKLLSVKCHYTKEPIPPGEQMVVGAVIPGVKSRFVIAKDSLPTHRSSIRAFHESEANCNTCVHLERVPHKKDKFGFLVGKCASPDGKPQANPYYKSGEETMNFHPDDPMHMPCHVQRQGRTNEDL